MSNADGPALTTEGNGSMLLETIGTCISIVTGAKDLYNLVSGIRGGDPMQKAVQQLEHLNSRVEKLSESILYAPNSYYVRDNTTTQQHTLKDLGQVREYLEPIQRATRGKILSSSMILTPDKMKRAMIADPRTVLQDITPATQATPHSNPQMVPIMFDYKGTRYIGWQMRGTIPMLFNLEYDSDLGIMKPPGTQPPLSSSRFATKEFTFGGNRVKADVNGGCEINLVNGGVWRFGPGASLELDRILNAVENGKASISQTRLQTIHSRTVALFKRDYYIYLNEDSGRQGYFLESEVSDLRRAINQILIVGTYNFGGNTITAYVLGQFLIRLENWDRIILDADEITSLYSILANLYKGQKKKFSRTNGSSIIRVESDGNRINLIEGSKEYGYFLFHEVDALLKAIEALRKQLASRLGM